MSSLLIALSLAGCEFKENLPEGDIEGTVIVPAEAATRVIVNEAGEEEEVKDLRFIGPVYLGAYSGIDTVSFSYPHPKMGPVVQPDVPGDAFPYGGTTVGRLDFACYSFISCRVTTGRFIDYDDILDYFRLIGRPVVDENGVEVQTGEAFQQACYNYYYATSDAEMAFLAGSDGLSFKENSDGDFEASFTLNHTLLEDGASVWGWMDAPQISTLFPDQNGYFSTCNESEGREETEYDDTFKEGVAFDDLLNVPSTYIGAGDWVTDDAPTLSVTEEDGTKTAKSITVRLGFQVEE